jgi:hypothetical protein
MQNTSTGNKSKKQQNKGLFILNKKKKKSTFVPLKVSINYFFSLLLYVYKEETNS